MLALTAATAAAGHALPSVAVLGTFLPTLPAAPLPAAPAPPPALAPPAPRPARRLLPAAFPFRAVRFGVGTDEPALALSFDDGPSAATPRTLELLDAYAMSATFFLVGEQAAAAPELVAEIVRRGHEVASHGMTHRHHLLSSPVAVLRDLEGSLQALQAAGAPRPRFFRPPYGQLAAATLAAARRSGVEIVLWSRWGREFAPGPLEGVRRRLESGIAPGAILLLHDSDAYAPAGTAGRTHAVLPDLAEALARRGIAARSIGALCPERS